MIQTNTIGMTRVTKTLIAGLIRDSFDKLDSTELTYKAPILITAASELGFNELAKGMREDMNHELKNN